METSKLPNIDLPTKLPKENRRKDTKSQVIDWKWSIWRVSSYCVSGFIKWENLSDTKL